MNLIIVTVLCRTSAGENLISRVLMVEPSNEVTADSNPSQLQTILSLESEDRFSTVNPRYIVQEPRQLSLSYPS